MHILYLILFGFLYNDNFTRGKLLVLHIATTINKTLLGIFFCVIWMAIYLKKTNHNICLDAKCHDIQILNIYMKQSHT